MRLDLQATGVCSPPQKHGGAFNQIYAAVRHSLRLPTAVCGTFGLHSMARIEGSARVPMLTPLSICWL